MKNSRNAYREVFFNVWKKIEQQDTIADPMENIISQIIKQHPEYHQTLSEYEKNIDKDYPPEAGISNPFMHMSMHISIAEQLSINQPDGIQSIYTQLCTKMKDTHATEHHIMDCLGETMWAAQKNQTEPDMQQYLNCIRKKL